MGRRGPRRTPTAILAARGSRLVQYRQDEPRPPVELPPCPAWARPEIRPHYAEIGELLVGKGLMAKPYTIALVLLCDALVDYLDFRERAEQSPRNTVFAYRRDNAQKRVMTALKEFGLTPATTI